MGSAIARLASDESDAMAELLDLVEAMGTAQEFAVFSSLVERVEAHWQRGSWSPKNDLNLLAEIERKMN